MLDFVGKKAKSEMKKRKAMLTKQNVLATLKGEDYHRFVEKTGKERLEELRMVGWKIDDVDLWLSRQKV